MPNRSVLASRFSRDAEFTRRLRNLRTAALSKDRIHGLTHGFYRYPARFSPAFAAAAIREFSEPNAIVLDPYMGGGTTVVEALRLGRQAIGCDLNALAVFVSRVKTTPLTASQREMVAHWTNSTIANLRYTHPRNDILDLLNDSRTRNLTLPRARPLKKLIGLTLHSVGGVRDPVAAEFARCAILNAAQWALNGRRHAPTLEQFRRRLTHTIAWMLEGLSEFAQELSYLAPAPHPDPVLIQDSAAHLSQHMPFVGGGMADLVVTSPPYPGIHILYHRWQVDGRRETPAPYWITAQNDGHGAAFYNFAGRQLLSSDKYFEESLRTLRSIRSVVRSGGLMIQMLAFSEAAAQLRRYLRNMEHAGFTEVRCSRSGSARRAVRIWRDVPNRAWHANMKTGLSSSREVVLIHEAV